MLGSVGDRFRPDGGGEEMVVSGRYWAGSVISTLWKAGGTLANAWIMLSWIMDLGHRVRGLVELGSGAAVLVEMRIWRRAVDR